MREFIVSAWRAGLRSRSIHAVLVLGLLLMGVAYLAAAFSVRQPRTVALDVGFSGIRLTLVLFALYWVQDLIGQEIQRRTVLFSLTYPIHRSYYVIGRFLGILGLLGLAAILLALLLGLIVLQVGKGYEQSFEIVLGTAYWATIAGFWLDVTVVASFGLWLATVSTVSILPLALGLAFAAGGKALGAAAEYLARGADGDHSVMALAPVIDSIQWVLPDLSRLDWRAWPMYGVSPDVHAAIGGVVMAISYGSLMLALAAFAFERREFV